LDEEFLPPLVELSDSKGEDMDDDVMEIDGEITILVCKGCR
jgi:hypothetical protein